MMRDLPINRFCSVRFDADFQKMLAEAIFGLAEEYWNDSNKVD
jgi:hypothetical protein